MNDRKLFTHIETEKLDWKQVKMAGGQTVEVFKEIKLTLKLAHNTFRVSFLVLQKSNSIISWKSIQETRYHHQPTQELTLIPGVNLFQSTIEPSNDSRRAVRAKRIQIYATKRQMIPQNKHVLVECALWKHCDEFAGRSGIASPSDFLEKETGVALKSSLSRIEKNNTLYITALNLTKNPITHSHGTELGKFAILTTEQADKLIQLDPQLSSLAKFRNQEDSIPELNQLVQDSTRKGKFQQPLPPPDYQSLWFPTPETCGDHDSLPPLQREIFNQLDKL